MSDQSFSQLINGGLGLLLAFVAYTHAVLPRQLIATEQSMKEARLIEHLLVTLPIAVGVLTCLVEVFAEPGKVAGALGIFSPVVDTISYGVGTFLGRLLAIEDKGQN